MKTAKHRCPICRKGTLRGTMCEQRREVAGVTFTAELACERCDACGETLVGHAGLERFDLAVAAGLARMGRRTGPALRFMRAALGYGSAELAKLLGVTPETFSRWQTGERAPDEHAFALVGTLAADRLAGDERTATVLRGVVTPRALPKRAVRVNVEARATLIRFGE